MRVKGSESLKRKIRDVIIGFDENDEPVSVRLTAIPLGGLEEIRAKLPFPEPPKGDVLRNSRGEAITDERGIPQQQLLTDDPGYIRRCKERDQAEAMAMVLACLEDGAVEFDTDPEDYPDPIDYYMSIRQEMSDFGVDYGALTKLVQAAAEVCGVTDTEIDEAREYLMGGAEKKVTTPAPGPGRTGGSSPSKKDLSPGKKPRGKTLTGPNKPY